MLIDVETAGLLTINGPDAADTVRRIAAELATSPASELIEVLVVGDEFDIAGSERLRAIATADDAIEAIAVASTSAQAALDRLGDPSTADARRDHSAEEGWCVTVLICLHPLSESQMTRLAKVARPRCGVAAVVVSEPVGGAWSLSTGPTARLDPHGFDLAPATLSADELARSMSYLRTPPVVTAKSGSRRRDSSRRRLPSRSASVVDTRPPQRD